MVNIPRIKFFAQRRYGANGPFVDGYGLHRAPEMFTHCQGTVDPVFVKTVAPVSATKPGALDTVDLFMPSSGRQAFRVVNRVMVDDFLDQFVGSDGGGHVQCHAERIFG